MNQQQAGEVLRRISEAPWYSDALLRIWLGSH